MANSRGADPIAADQNKQINWAYRIIARKCFLTADTSLVLVNGQSTYNIRDVANGVVGAKIIKPFIVYINQKPLIDASGRDYGLWTYNELMRIRPHWKLDAPGTPSRAVFFNGDTLILHLAPDAGTAAGTHSIYGHYLPSDLALDADVPVFSEEIHEAVAWLAAQVASVPVLSEKAGWDKMAKYQEYWTQIIEDVANQNLRTLQSFGSTHGYYNDDYIVG
jgi:hypothetical protein